MTRLRFPVLMSLALFTVVCTVAPVVAQHPGTVPTGPVGFSPGVNYNYDNFAYSPNIRKFVDSLPGLGLPGCSTAVPPPPGIPGCNQNNLGQYIPIALKSNNALGYGKDDYYSLGITQFSLKLHSDLPATTLRGYYQMPGTGPGQSGAAAAVYQYLGPVIVAKSFDPSKPAGDSLNGALSGLNVNGNGAPTRVLYQNLLPLTTWNATTGQPGGPANLFLPVDPTLMGAGPGPNLCSTCTGGWAPYTQNRTAIHLHGGNTPWISDGTPHQWITPKGETFPNAGTFLSHYQKGDSFQNVPDMIGTGKSITTASQGDGLGTLYYTNQQSQRLMFYHDHAYGITRLNVYAGMAAGYLLHDQVEDDMIFGTNDSGAFSTAKAVLPNLGTSLGAQYTWGVPLVIQDRTFVNDTGSAPNTAAITRAGGIPTAQTLNTDPSERNSYPAPVGHQPTNSAQAETSGSRTNTYRTRTSSTPTPPQPEQCLGADGTMDPG